MLLRHLGLPGVCLALTLGLAAGCRDSEPPPEVSAGRPAAPPRILPLIAGSEVESTLAPGETHSYRIDLPQDHFADLVVDQRGADVELRLTGPDGRSFPKVDSRNRARGPEPLPVLGAAGPFRLEISGSSSGHYAVKVQAVRPATPRDRALVEAERGFAAAEGLRRQGDGESLRAAAAGAEEAAARFRALGERGREADALYALGDIRNSRGEPQAALQAFEEALPIFRDLEDRTAVGRTLNFTATNLRNLGDLGTARERAQEALAISRSLGDTSEEAAALHNLGRIQATLGRTEEALASYHAALVLWQRLGLEKNKGGTLNQRGALYASLGDTPRALDDLNEAFRLLKGPADIAPVLAERGYLFLRMGRKEEAAADLERALAFYQKAGGRRAEAGVLSDLGQLRQQQERREEARHCFEAAAATFRELGDHPSEATALVSLGWLRERSGDAAGAEAAFQRALTSFETAGRRDGEAAAWLGLGHARRDRGDLQGALRAAEAALARIEELRVEPGSDRLRISFFASHQEVFAFAVDTAMELHGTQPAAGFDARAFELSERARARGLLDALSEAGADPKREVDPALLAREAAAGERLASAEQRRLALVNAGAPQAQVAEAERYRRGRLGELERVEAEIRRASRRSAASRPLSLEEVRKELDPDTLLLAYALGERRSFLWVVGSRGIDSWKLPPRKELEAAARRAYTLLADRRLLGHPQAGAALEELSRLLLAPAAGRLAGHRLVMVPDGALHLLPFAALPDPALGGGGPPLIARREVVIAPSSSSLAAIRRRAASRTPPPAVVAVFADPVFTADDPRVTHRPGGPASDVTRSAKPSRIFKRLPGSKDEARMLLALAPPGERLSALDFAAHRKLVTGGALERFRFLHFATHSVVDLENPEFSGIALSMVDEQGRPQDDGFLYVYEIYRLRLPADLVVLSACETARGREIRGEGVVGLTRAFFHAGARRVLVSLWPVQDQATAELMRTFYKGLFTRGLSPAAALREAQNEVRRQPGYQDPYYWAGFTLQGDWR